MTEYKNVRPHPVDVGGRLVPAEARLHLDPAAPAVVEAVAAGHLVITVPAPPAAEMSSPRRGRGATTEHSLEEN